MKREPPQLAAWLLEYGIPGDHDPALTGDLLEDFRSGRSDAWFWRQALFVCANAWWECLRARVPLLIFVLLWSILAPAWKVLMDRLQSLSTLDRIWRFFGPAWILPAFANWLFLQAAFLGLGIFLFLSLFFKSAREYRKNKFGRALFLGILLFLPVYAATFVWVSLYWFSSFAGSQLVANPLREIADLRLLADVGRLPYALALLGALWNAVPRERPTSVVTSGAGLVLGLGAAPEVESESPVLTRFALRRFLVFVIGTGLLNALIVGFLLCRLPDAHNPSVFTLARRAIVYVFLGGIGGIAGTYLYWKNPSSPFRKAAPLPFWLFGVTCASAWIWVPAMVIFSEQLSGLTALVAAIGATLLAAGLRHATSSLFAPPPRASLEPEASDLFTESLYRPPFEFHGYLIALCLYAAGWALATHSNYTACTLLAISAFLFAWKRTFTRAHRPDPNREYKRAALRLALVFLPAVLVTFWSLLDGVAHRNRVEGEAALAAARGGADTQASAAKKDDATTPASANGISGYQSVILWPVPEKKQIVAPVPRAVNLLAPGTTKPLVIRFDGPYLYYQPPHKAPSTNAHQAHATPLDVDIQTNNFVALIMQAHQNLGVSIPVARVRELQVDVLNRDNHRGFISLAVFLTDSAHPDNQLYLGQQTLLSSQPSNFTVKFAPAPESLHFSVPTVAPIRKFDEITVMFLPDESNYDRGPKIALQQFQLIPR